ncbi:MAG TPA: amidase [Hyphomicrobiales bacterium]|nr:amidase [Hyphomicrobiales bacterium]
MVNAASPDYRSATALASEVRRGAVSAAELTEQAIARIEALDGPINAVVVRDFERARAAAKAADAARARGEDKPLLGVPMTVKEAFDVAGLPTTWGVPSNRDHRAIEDAPAVARLKAAGAIVLGKTNVARWLADWQSDNELYGVTNNPWNLAFTPGGSSGGAAAALAAGMVPLEIGSDIGGSIRVPSHFCGVFGHKPTYGLVPQRGHALPGALHVADLNVCGPMARGAADLDLALGLLAGPDEEAAAAYRLALPPPRHAALRDFRVLVIDRHPLAPTAEAIRAALDRLAAEVAGAGAKVGRASDLVPDLADAGRTYVQLLMAESGTRATDEDRRQSAEAAAKLSPDDVGFAALRLRAANLPHHRWIALDERRQRIRRQWRRLFEEWDVVLAPPLSTTAFRHDPQPSMRRRVTVDGHEIVHHDALVWPGLATLPGLPSTAMPVGVSAEGLPIGVQIMGAAFDDRTTIAFAGHLERAFGGFVPPPGYA